MQYFKYKNYPHLIFHAEHIVDIKPTPTAAFATPIAAATATNITTAAATPTAATAPAGPSASVSFSAPLPPPIVSDF
jgi:hypothetical protein